MRRSAFGTLKEYRPFPERTLQMVKIFKLAQLVERLPFKRYVVGSTPTFETKKRKDAPG